MCLKKFIILHRLRKIYKEKYQNFFNKIKENENVLTKSLIIEIGKIIKN